MVDRTTYTKTTLTEVANRVMPYLDGVAYPVAKDELVAHASQRGAPEEVLSVLDVLPDRTYGSLAVVTDEIEALTAERTPEAYEETFAGPQEVGQAEEEEAFEDEDEEEEMGGEEEKGGA